MQSAVLANARRVVTGREGKGSGGGEGILCIPRSFAVEALTSHSVHDTIGDICPSSN